MRSDDSRLSPDETTVVVSIVVPAYNELENLPGLLDTLEVLRDDKRFEILVVDNGSTDDTAGIARTRGVRVLRIDRLPVGAGRNVGARQSTGTVLAFLDADVLVTKEWEAAIKRLADSGSLNTITGDVYDTVQPPSWIERHWFGAHYAAGAHRYINAGNLIISRNDFLKIGGFSESMIAGEDVEFCRRAASLQVSLRPDRDFRVLHKGYPATISGFIAREAWHGRGEFISPKAFLGSRIAALTLAFTISHLAVVAFLLSGKWSLAAMAAGSIMALCLTCSMWKWRNASFGSRLANAIIFYFYFIGRSIAGIRDVLSTRER